MTKYDAVVVGSGPNGLAAALVLAAHGLAVAIQEQSATIGGGMRTKELTLPGFRHDVCSAVHALGSNSPIFSRFDLAAHGLTWCDFPVECAQPIAGELGVALYKDFDRTVAQFTDSGASFYQRLLGPMRRAGAGLFRDTLGPVPFVIPKNPLALLGFGLRSIWPADWLMKLTDDRKVRALFAGMAAHSILPFDAWLTSAIGMMLTFSGHSLGWPIAKGGSQSLADALASQFKALGGTIVLGSPIATKADLLPARAVIFTSGPRLLASVYENELPAAYVRRLKDFRYGPGVYKVDWALSEPVPFLAKECREASTVHFGGDYEDIQTAEKAVSQGRVAERPFVLFSQPTVADPSRAPTGKHIGYGYCHVPANCEVDMLEAIENQIERFAPGFKDTILARHVMTPRDMAAYNPNYIGGDITGGIQDFAQQFVRPTFGPDPYRTPLGHVYLASSSTPPGAGVHGMCGYYAAASALKKVFGMKLKPEYVI